jgi:hypothetical protein
MKRIDVLPDDVLLEIFDFYIIMNLRNGDFPSYEGKGRVEAWQSLVHVCRRWRSLIFGSPRRLNLRLYCTPKTRDTLGIWPALPLIIQGDMVSSSGTDNVIAALGQSNRICQVRLLHLAGSQLEKVLAPMQVPFPELTDLRLRSYGNPQVIPDSFLGGSAPRLRHFELDSIPFPGLPKLLLSATHLVSLVLFNIPHAGYFSPEAMVAPLSMLSSLRILCLEFLKFLSSRYPDRKGRSLPPPKRSILPALHEFHFTGVTGYLEDLVTFIDAPQLDHMHITFFNSTGFDCLQLAQFINCTPKLRARDEVHVQFGDFTADVTLRYRTSNFDCYDLPIIISCHEPVRQLSSIEQVCNSLPPLSMVEDLYIVRRSVEVWKNGAIENSLWLRLLLPFTAVKNLYLSKEFEPDIAASLQELVGGRITEVLPSLQNIFVEELEPWGENNGQFVTARQLSGHPVVISIWNNLVWI